jgi:predicted dehydrogenase
VKKKIRYAVVGLGHIAQTAVLPAFEHAENSELATLVTGNPKKIQTGRWRSSARQSNKPNWSAPALRIPHNQF